MTQFQRREAALHWIVAFILGAAFPRLAYRLRWPSRLGARGLVAYVAFNTTIGFGLRTWLSASLKRRAGEVERP